MRARVPTNYSLVIWLTSEATTWISQVLMFHVGIFCKFVSPFGIQVNGSYFPARRRSSLVQSFGEGILGCSNVVNSGLSYRAISAYGYFNGSSVLMNGGSHRSIRLPQRGHFIFPSGFPRGFSILDLIRERRKKFIFFF